MSTLDQAEQLEELAGIVKQMSALLEQVGARLEELALFVEQIAIPGWDSEQRPLAASLRRPVF